MKKILILIKLLLVALIVSGQPVVDSSTWNKKVLKSNVYVRAGMVIDSSVIMVQNLQADSVDFNYVYIEGNTVINAGDLLTGTTSTYDIGSDASRWDSAYIDNVMITNNLTIQAATQDYVFKDIGSALAIESQTSAQPNLVSFHTMDGDGTDDCKFQLFAVGTSASIVDRERMFIGYEATGTEFEIQSEANGTGTLRPIVLYTEGNTDQLKVKIDGDISMSGNLAVTGYISGGTYGTQGFADSSVTLDMTQSIYSTITGLFGNLWTDGIEYGDLVFTGDSIQVVTAGNYKVSWNGCYSGTNTDEYHIEIFVAGVGQSGKGEAIRDMSTSNIGCSSGITILTIGANEWVTLRISNMNNNNDATIVSFNLTIERK